METAAREMTPEEIIDDLFTYHAPTPDVPSLARSHGRDASAARGTDDRELVHRYQERRGLTNPGELVLSPFAGIGSEGHEAVRLGRRFVGVELKPEYFSAAVKNLRRADVQQGLFTTA